LRGKLFGPYKRQSRVEAKKKGGRLNKKPGTKTQAKPRRGASATGGELTKKINPETRAKTGGRTLETEKVWKTNNTGD
jgi:hypothetical protein